MQNASVFLNMVSPNRVFRPRPEGVQLIMTLQRFPMPTSKFLPVADLKLDLQNFRTVPQKSESKFLHAVTTIGPDKFWALVNSLLDDGYLPTESIIVWEKSPRVYIVKEGNRRISALKWIFGSIRPTNLNVPTDITDKVAEVSAAWKLANGTVPCTIFSAKEEELVKKVVSRTHGKSELSGRDPWLSVAKARHNRDENKASEPSLDLLEKYLVHGKTASVSQRELWAGDYPLSILEEALKVLSPRLKRASSREVANDYPGIPHLSSVDELLRDIGLELVSFRQLRGGDILDADYGIPPVNQTQGSGTSGSANAASSAGAGSASGSSGAGSGGNSAGTKPKSSKAHPLNDHRAVRKALRTLSPRGKGREKVVTLVNEARCLNLADNPIAFCFLLRSMFEISAKAYCKDHAATGLSATDPKGNDKRLVDVLRDVTKHMTNNGTDKGKTKHLHGALTELAKSEGLLSVTSMNQLVHHPKFSVSPDDICILFFNVLPLLEELNA